MTERLKNRKSMGNKLDYSRNEKLFASFEKSLGFQLNVKNTMRIVKLLVKRRSLQRFQAGFSMVSSRSAAGGLSIVKQNYFVLAALRKTTRNEELLFRAEGGSKIILGFSRERCTLNVRKERFLCFSAFFKLFFGALR